MKVIGGRESRQTKLILQWRGAETLRGGEDKGRAVMSLRRAEFSREQPQKPQRLVSKLRRALAHTARRVEQCHLAAERVKFSFVANVQFLQCSIFFFFTDSVWN